MSFGSVLSSDNSCAIMVRVVVFSCVVCVLGAATAGAQEPAAPLQAREAALAERGLVWMQKPGGVYWANATGGTYWLQPAQGDTYRVTFVATDGELASAAMETSTRVIDRLPQIASTLLQPEGSVAPGQPARPKTATAVPGLFLAGDWIDTGLPATIESAVVSGHAAADAVLDFLKSA